MTNEQLYFHTKQLRDRLALEIDRADDLMPDSVERVENCRHKKIKCSAGFFHLCMDTSHYEDVKDGEYIPLVGLVDWLKQLDDDLELLKAAIERNNEAAKSAA